MSNSIPELMLATDCSLELAAPGAAISIEHPNESEPDIFVVKEHRLSCSLADSRLLV